MTRTRLNPQTRAELAKMLMNGMTPTKAAEKLDITVGHAARMRKKLVNAGTVESMRTRNKKTKKSKTPLLKSIGHAPKVSTTRTTALQFRLNGVDFSIDKASKVVVENGVVDIKY